MQKPVIFFDWDGTLADSMPLCIREIELALAQMGLPALPRERIAQCNGPTYAESVAILGIPDGRGEEFLRLRQAAELTLVPTVQRLFPGTKDMLEKLTALADLAIVSNGLAEYLHQSLEVTGVKALFTRVQPLIPGKTKPEALAMLLRDMQPERAIMVGDRLGDFVAGRSNGLPTVAACFGYGHESEWREADVCVGSVSELADSLERFCRSGSI